MCSQYTPVVCQLLDELLPVSAGTQVDFVHPSDVLNYLFSFNSLGERYGLGDICSNFRYVLGF